MVSLIPWRKITSIPIQHQRRENPFMALQTELDRAMRDFYNLLESPSFPTGDFEELTISPSVDIVEDKDNFKVEAEMPGLNEDNIKIDISDGQLTIRGEKTTSKQDKDKNYLSREISYGSYERIIALPDTVDIDQAKASFKKGMLWITIPKKAEATQRSRQLKVEKVTETEGKTTTTEQETEKTESGQ